MGCGFRPSSPPKCTSKAVWWRSRLIETIQRERISVLAAVPRVLALLKTPSGSRAIPALASGSAASRGTSRLAALVALPRCSLGVRPEVLGADLRRRGAAGCAGAVLERAGIRRGAGLRNDRNHRADHAQPPLPRGAGNHRQAAAGARGQAGSGRRSAGARRDDLRRHLVGRRSAAARRRVAGHRRPGRERSRAASCAFWAARAR